MSYFEKSCSSAKQLNSFSEAPILAIAAKLQTQRSAYKFDPLFLLDSPKGHTKRSAWKCLLLCKACLCSRLWRKFFDPSNRQFHFKQVNPGAVPTISLPLLLNLITPLLPFTASKPNAVPTSSLYPIAAILQTLRTAYKFDPLFSFWILH